VLKKGYCVTIFVVDDPMVQLDKTSEGNGKKSHPQGNNFLEGSLLIASEFALNQGQVILQPRTRRRRMWNPWFCRVYLYIQHLFIKCNFAIEEDIYNRTLTS